MSGTSDRRVLPWVLALVRDLAEEPVISLGRRDAPTHALVTRVLSVDGQRAAVELELIDSPPPPTAPRYGGDFDALRQAPGEIDELPWFSFERDLSLAQNIERLREAVRDCVFHTGRKEAPPKCVDDVPELVELVRHGSQPPSSGPARSGPPRSVRQPPRRRAAPPEPPPPAPPIAGGFTAPQRPPSQPPPPGVSPSTPPPPLSGNLGSQPTPGSQPNPAPPLPAPPVAPPPPAAPGFHSHRGEAPMINGPQTPTPPPAGLGQLGSAAGHPATRGRAESYSAGAVGREPPPPPRRGPSRPPSVPAMPPRPRMDMAPSSAPSSGLPPPPPPPPPPPFGEEEL